MSRSCVSIKDIAKNADVSHSTVSRALHNSPLIALETRQRIQRIAREMGYTPSAIARSLVTRRTHTIGLVVTTISDPFISEVVRGVEETALNNDYSVILCNCNAESERELASVRALQEKRVDAIIVTASRVGSLYVPRLEKLNIPIVLINNQQAGRYLHSVSTDNFVGGRLAGEYLLSLGHRRIAYLGIVPDAYASVERLEGCRAVLQEHGLDIHDDWLLSANGRADGGQAGVARLLRCATRPTAIFCYNDVTAIGALQALKAAGLRVPGDISLIGYDDIAFTVFIDPPLTTIAQPKYTLGRRAMELTLALLNGQEEAGDIVLVPHLIERASCAPPRS